MTHISSNQFNDYQDIENLVHIRFVELTQRIFRDFCKKMREYYPSSRKIRWRGKFVTSLITIELYRINDYIAQCVTSDSSSAYRDVIIYSILYARLAHIGKDYIYKQFFKKYQNE